MKKIALVSALVIAASFYVEASTVLWYGVNPDATVKKADGDTTVVAYSDSQFPEINLMRIRVMDEISDTFISLYFQDENGTYVLEDEYGPMTETILDNGGAYWGSAAIPDSYGPDTKLRMELGYADLEDYDSVFQMVAFSDVFTLEYLDEMKYMYQTFTLAPPIETPWTPDTYYTETIPVPEPNTWFLAIVGVIPLLIRRMKVLK